ncbi:MAG: chemotaxis protein CheX [Bdellovibrionia bacterium]
MNNLFGDKNLPECKLISLDEYLILKLSGPLTKETATLFEDEFRSILGEPHRNLIINMESVLEVSKTWLRRLVQLQVDLRGFNCKLQIILLNEILVKRIKDEGLERLLPISKSLRDALVDLNIVSRKQLDVNFVNPFLHAIVHVLQIEAKIKAQPEGIRLKTRKGEFAGDISGVIGIISNSFRGMIVISFPTQTFLNVINKMLGENHTELNDEIESGAAELTNIVLGLAKNTLNDRGYGIKSALPSVVRGENHGFSQLGSGPTIIVPFQTDVGPFYAEICLSD